jgi:SAM-dependent methyltransferase
MPPEESGRWLLERMRQHIGLETYADKAILDFGCGVRFSQAIINTGYSVGRYVGIDNYREMIEFLQQTVRDSRFEYHFLDANHPLYNRSGKTMAAATSLPIREDAFDVVCMFSVITHQNPTDSRSIFTMLRKYVAPNGTLFFTCFLDSSISQYEDRSPEQNGGRCFYQPDYLIALVEGCGWKKVGSAVAEGPIIGDSFVFRPV